MIVNSAQLEEAAAAIRKRKHGPQTIPREGVTVSAAQLDAAAYILKTAEPSVCNGNVSERPGFIDKEEQGPDPEVLIFQMGILPPTLFQIDRKGHILVLEFPAEASER